MQVNTQQYEKQSLRVTPRLKDKRTYDDLVVGAAKTTNDSMMVRYKDGPEFNNLRGKACVWQQDRYKTDGDFVVEQHNNIVRYKDVARFNTMRGKASVRQRDSCKTD